MKSTTTQRVKKLFEAGRELTVIQLDRMCSTNNSPQIVQRLKKAGMNIKLEWRRNKNTKKRFGVYYNGDL